MTQRRKGDFGRLGGTEGREVRGETPCLGRKQQWAWVYGVDRSETTCLTDRTVPSPEYGSPGVSPPGAGLSVVVPSACAGSPSGVEPPSVAATDDIVVFPSLEIFFLFSKPSCAASESAAVHAVFRIGPWISSGRQT